MFLAEHQAKPGWPTKAYDPVTRGLRYSTERKASQVLKTTWGNGKPGWLAMTGLVLIIGVMLGCGSTSEAEDSGGDTQFAEFDCVQYSPVGTGSWGPGASLSEFRDAEVLVKAEVTGHQPHVDLRQLNHLKVLKVLKGNVLPGDQIVAASGGGVCLPNGQVIYLYLSAPAVSSTNPGSDSLYDPETRQRRGVYYIVHPFAQFPIVDGRVAIHESFLRPDQSSEVPSQVHGLTEEELESLLRQAIQ